MIIVSSKKSDDKNKINITFEGNPKDIKKINFKIYGEK